VDTTLTEQQRLSIRVAFGKKVRSKRLEVGISQEELAFQSGLHRTYVGSVERGERNISLENIYLLAKSLNCKPSEFVPDLF
jgi:transcriptional regulator with XRE-family HTH domain